MGWYRWDLKKAFDKVLDKSFMWKQENGGLKGAALRWMEDYLQGKEMRIVIMDTKSSWRCDRCDTTRICVGTHYVSNICK